MQKVKLFKSIENDLEHMEEEINQWITESKAKVISITGNIAPQSSGGSPTMGSGHFASSDLFVIVLYEE